MHEQDRAGRSGRIGGLVPHVEADVVALVGPVLLAADRRRHGFVHVDGSLICYAALISPPPARKTLQSVASTSIAQASPTLKCCNGWVCTRSVRPEGKVASYSLMLPRKMWLRIVARVPPVAGD